jgi:hypothetical protein
MSGNEQAAFQIRQQIELIQTLAFQLSDTHVNQSNNAAVLAQAITALQTVLGQTP